MAFLFRQYKTLAVYCAIVAVAIGFGLGGIAAGAFILGAFLSLLAGFVGLLRIGEPMLPTHQTKKYHLMLDHISKIQESTHPHSCGNNPHKNE